MMISSNMNFAVDVGVILECPYFYLFGSVVRGGNNVFVLSTFGRMIDWSYNIQTPSLKYLGINNWM